MRHINIKARGISAGLLPCLLIASIGLGACGSSSTGSAASATTQTAAAPTSTPTTANTPGTGTGSATTTPAHPSRLYRQVAAFVACMGRNGITLPPPDATGHLDLKAVDTSGKQYQTVGKKCLQAYQKAGQ